MTEPCEKSLEDRYADVMRLFVKPLSGKFTMVPGDEKKPYFDMLCKQLGGFEADTLELASTKIAREVSGRRWPDYAVAIAACKAVMGVKPARKRQDGERYSLPTDAVMRILLADGREQTLEACNGDWISVLFDFVKAKHRYPSDREIEGLIVEVQARETRLKAQRVEALKVLYGEKASTERALPDRHPVQMMINAFAKRRMDLCDAVFLEVYGCDVATLAADDGGQAYATA
ncbi:MULTISPECIES: hypothetical protein [unclassified Pseudovibrio]|uniref:hypothetical protein n=1 Tax=unclassified Pseudovibrio TaxID=2627060 RepID=UPI0007AE8555|nr:MULTISPECIES: hypothetical protein [unclassified Pseudovibrio]KZL02801.1 hypothetical protein PsW74_00995 [Pseudovibrio sp. W74]KZL07504.1 hypothetical protein PsAD14_03890 [Pseudovibrio sp. Ad14]